MIYDNFFVSDELTDLSPQESICEILIENGNEVFKPVVIDEITLESFKSNSPSILIFSVIQDGNLRVEHGNSVSFRCNGQPMFYGYVFEKSETQKNIVKIKCYDQLRFFKNKTTITYENMTYSNLLTYLAGVYKLKIGEIDDSFHRIAQRIEEGTVFDILGNASDETIEKTGKRFVLYDDFGKLNLKEISSLFVPIMIGENAVSAYQYKTDIDKDVYTKVSIAKDNDFTGKRDLFVAQDTKKQALWGVLEYYERKNSLEDGLIREMAQSLLKEYGEKKSSLTLFSCLGDFRVRGGSSLVVSLSVSDRNIYDIMTVEQVKHSWKNAVHSMNLYLSGREKN